VPAWMDRSCFWRTCDFCFATRSICAMSSFCRSWSASTRSWMAMLTSCRAASQRRSMSEMMHLTRSSAVSRVQ